MSELPVPAVKPPEPPTPETLVCANCGTPLAGEYCSACGQRHEPHVHTVGHFVGEAFEAISHADSRLWQTLWLLLAKPGRLTKEFFAGHRVRYLPPIRLYIVLSLVAVVLSSINARPDRNSPPANGNGTAPIAASPVTPPATSPAATPATTQASTEPAPSVAADAPADEPNGDVTPLPTPPGDVVNVKQRGYEIDIDGLNDFCDKFENPDEGGGNVSARRNIKRFCTRVRYDASELMAVVAHSIPRAMFVLLPLIAAFMKLLYWRPPRYYVEHLLFLVHNHAAAFLLYTLVVLYSFIPVINGLTPLVVFIGLGYLAWYVFRAMRAYYGQGWWLTFAKYSLLFWLYVITAIAGFLFTLVLVAILG